MTATCCDLPTIFLPATRNSVQRPSTSRKMGYVLIFSPVDRLWATGVWSLVALRNINKILVASVTVPFITTQPNFNDYAGMPSMQSTVHLIIDDIASHQILCKNHEYNSYCLWSHPVNINNHLLVGRINAFSWSRNGLRGDSRDLGLRDSGLLIFCSVLNIWENLRSLTTAFTCLGFVGGS